MTAVLATLLICWFGSTHAAPTQPAEPAARYTCTPTHTHIVLIGVSATPRPCSSTCTSVRRTASIRMAAPCTTTPAATNLTSPAEAVTMPATTNTVCAGGGCHVSLPAALARQLARDRQQLVAGRGSVRCRSSCSGHVTHPGSRATATRAAQCRRRSRPHTQPAASGPGTM